MKRTALVLSLLIAASCGAKKAAPSNPGADAGAAATTEKSYEPLWLVHDNGKRCIVAPCPSWTVLNVDSRDTADVAKIDLTALKLGPKEEAEARAKVQEGHIWARGTIVTQEKMGPAGDGRILMVTALIDATGKMTGGTPK